MHETFDSSGSCMCIAYAYLMVELVPNYSGLAYNIELSALGFIAIM